MHKPKASTIVRSLMIVKRKGTVMFNDSIVDGRSIKVWGWELQDYAEAANALESYGYKVKYAPRRKTKRNPSPGFRIHVLG
jgi:hypothetical protein